MCFYIFLFFNPLRILSFLIEVLKFRCKFLQVFSSSSCWILGGSSNFRMSLLLEKYQLYFTKMPLLHSFAFLWEFLSFARMLMYLILFVLSVLSFLKFSVRGSHSQPETLFFFFFCMPLCFSSFLPFVVMSLSKMIQSWPRFYQCEIALCTVLEAKTY